MISDVWSENEIPKPSIKTPHALYKMGVVSQCIQANEAAALGHLWVLRDSMQKDAEEQQVFFKDILIQGELNEVATWCQHCLGNEKAL